MQVTSPRLCGRTEPADEGFDGISIHVKADSPASRKRYITLIDRWSCGTSHLFQYRRLCIYRWQP